MHTHTKPSTGHLAVVLVNYASHALLERNLDPSLGEHGISVVVVDNFSSDAEQQAVRELAADRGWELVASPTNVGFGDGVNLGVTRARELGCTSVVLLNPDAVVTIPVLQELHRSVEADPAALVCPRMNRSDGRHYFRGSRLDYTTGHLKGGWPDDGTEDAEGRWKPWLTAACLAIHLSAWERIGGFSEGYFLYWEDVDLTRRAAEAGLHLVLRQDLVAVHDEGGTQERTDSRALSDTYYYWNARNRLLFASRHLGRADLARWIVRTPAESWEILMRGGKRQLLHSRSPLVATAKGSAAGLGLALKALVTGPGRDATTAPAAPRRASCQAAGQGVDSVLVAHPSPDLYGSDRVMLETVSGLVESGSRVTVALPGDGPLVPELTARGAEVVFVEMPVLRKSALKPRGFVELVGCALRTLPQQLALVRRVEADAVLVNTVTIPMWGLVGRLAGRSVVVHVHEAEGSASMLVKRVLYAPLFLAHHLVLNSTFAEQVLTSAYPSLGRRSTVVYNGVPGPAEVEPLRAEPVPVNLLFIGRLSPRKGPDVAVDALAELTRRGIDARLGLLGAVFPGYEWFEEELHEQVERLGLADRVDFLGFRPTVWPTMAEHDIVLVPSVADEPFGNTAVEAILAGRALVVSDTSGLREASSGFEAVRRVEAGSPSAIADGVASLVEDWALVCEQVVADRASAMRRYGPEVYRAAIVAEVERAVLGRSNA
ncbi:glycosyltransferase [Luteococcus sp.]|uniref:glycosyltransferase n=1 Tax=Luteococcus sp. TaxID=1969402 RepID=UPI0037363BAC